MNKLIVPIALIVILVVGGGIYLSTRNEEKAESTNLSSSSTSTVEQDTTNNNKDTSMKNIVEIAQEDGRFTTLVKAVVAADLTETLSSEGPFTVFAPTDDAFKALGDETLNAVLADKAKLTSILTYHVVPEKLLAADVVAQSSLTTVQGGSLSVTSSPSAMVNDANIVITDIQASNGVIHVIDKVLLPNS